MDKGLQFTYDSGFEDSDPGNIDGFLAKGHGGYWTLDQSLFLDDAGQSVLSSMLKAAAEQKLSDFSIFVAKLTVGRGLHELSANTTLRPAGRVQVKMSGASFIKCSPDIKLDNKSVPDGVFLEADSKNGLIAWYADLLGNTKSGTVLEIHGPKVMDFELKFEDAILKMLRMNSTYQRY